MGPCHHGVTRPQVADGGDGLHIWRVAADTLNKQSRTADKGCHSACGVRRGLTTTYVIKYFVQRVHGIWILERQWASRRPYGKKAAMNQHIII
jgi:hypothetical protein